MKEISDERVPLKTFAALVAFQKIVRSELPKVNQPLRIYASPQDHVVNPSNARYVIDHVGSRDKELIWLERSYHVAPLDDERQQIFQSSIEFFRRVTG